MSRTRDVVNEGGPTFNDVQCINPYVFPDLKKDTV